MNRKKITKGKHAVIEMGRGDTASHAAQIAPPEVLLEAANKAPRVFSIGAYFRPIYVMREKGHSWRALVVWLKQFNIEISHEQLRRLYQQESERLSRLTRKELRALNMPEDMIDDMLERSDPTKRIASIDAEDFQTKEDESDEP